MWQNEAFNSEDKYAGCVSCCSSEADGKIHFNSRMQSLPLNYYQFEQEKTILACPF